MIFHQDPDGSQTFILDGQAILFMVLNAIWTSILIAGCVFLVINRDVQCVRVRNLPVSIAAVGCLHMYCALVMHGHSFNGWFPCGVEYWVMSTYLPLGIALFQASNVELLSVASTQGRMLSQNSEKAPVVQSPRPSLRGYWLRLNSINLLKRTQLAIAAGMVIQIVVALIVYLTSRKFVSFGVFSEEVSPSECRRGTEWLPSILWQFLWAWLFAPYILWRIRNIKDVHHWRLQTTICVLAGLPASPLWLGALYSDSAFWAKVNLYWAPPQWFIIPIMTMEAVTIFIPCAEVLRSRSHQKYVSGVLREWENRRVEGNDKSITSSSGAPSSKQTKSSRRSEMYTRSSFEKYLGGDAAPLLHFAASREFTGENIMFLNYVRDWKAAWEQAKPNEARFRSHFFKVAVEIYADYVDIKSAEFPINIESHIYVKLRKMFGEAARHLNRPTHDNTVSPFVYGDRDDHRNRDSTSTIQLVNRDSKKDTIVMETALPPWGQTDHYPGVSKNIINIEPHLPDDIHIPSDFGPRVFDEADVSVKHMVFLNTWPKFVEISVEEAASLDDEEKGTVRPLYRSKSSSRMSRLKWPLSP